MTDECSGGAVLRELATILYVNAINVTWFYTESSVLL